MINELMVANLSIIIETFLLQMIFLLQVFQIIFRDEIYKNHVIQINIQYPFFNLTEFKY
jgi:hypothetical protein